MSIKIIELPVPLPSVQPRGAVLDDADFTPTSVRSFRITDEDYSTVIEAAKITGTSVSEFVRWCALYSATDICRQHTRR